MNKFILSLVLLTGASATHAAHAVSISADFFEKAICLNENADWDDDIVITTNGVTTVIDCGKYILNPNTIAKK